MKCPNPKCNSERIYQFTEGSAYNFCDDCECTWTDWQQSEIDRQSKEIEVLNINLKGWHDATNALLDEKKKLETALSALRENISQAVKLLDAEEGTDLIEACTQLKQGMRITLSDRNTRIETLERELGKCKPSVNPDEPLHVSIVGACLQIRIGMEILAFAFEEHEDNNPFDEERNNFKRLWKVSDKEEFAKDVIHAMSEEAENGATPLTDFIDKMCQAAAEDGSIAIDEAGSIPEPTEPEGEQ